MVRGYGGDGERICPPVALMRQSRCLWPSGPSLAVVLYMFSAFLCRGGCTVILEVLYIICKPIHRFLCLLIAAQLHRGVPPLISSIIIVILLCRNHNLLGLFSTLCLTVFWTAFLFFNIARDSLVQIRCVAFDGLIMFGRDADFCGVSTNFERVEFTGF